MKSKMTIGKKLLLSVGSLLFMTIVIGIASMYSIMRLNSGIDAGILRTKRMELVGLIDAAGSDMLAGQRGIAMYSFAKSPEGIQRSKVLVKGASEIFQKSVEQLRPIQKRADSKQLLNELQQEFAAWTTVIADISRLAEQGDSAAAVSIAKNQGVPIYNAVMQATDRLRGIQNENLASEKQAAADLNIASRWTVLVLIGLSLATGGVVFLIVRRTNSALQRAAIELGRTAGKVTQAAAQISSSSQALAQGVSEQAASITETSASAEQITAMTRRNADHSRSATELMDQTSAVVNDANHTLDLMQSSMRDINSSSDKIGQIIKVIDGIAFQTNILALNAAVEAARAGDAGMGFAVVADEVRNLAQRSAQAARDTSSLIEESIVKSGDGRNKLDHLSAAILAITDKAEKVKTLIKDVHAGSEEQASGVEQIAKAMNQMDQVTHNSAASAEQTAAAGESMNSQAVAIRRVVEELEQMVGAEV